MMYVEILLVIAIFVCVGTAMYECSKSLPSARETLQAIRTVLQGIHRIWGLR